MAILNTGPVDRDFDGSNDIFLNVYGNDRRVGQRLAAPAQSRLGVWNGPPYIPLVWGAFIVQGR